MEGVAESIIGDYKWTTTAIASPFHAKRGESLRFRELGFEASLIQGLEKLHEVCRASRFRGPVSSAERICR